MMGSAQMKRASAAAGPSVIVPVRRSEFHHVGNAEDDRVDLDIAKCRPARVGVGFDVDVAQVGPDGSLFADCEVDTGPDEGGHTGIVGEVTLQRDRGRQVLGFGNVAGGGFDVVLEGRGGEHFDTDVVSDEILKRQGRARVAIGAQRACSSCAVAVGGLDIANTEAKKHVALFLRERGGGDSGEGRGESESCEFFMVFFFLFVRVMRAGFCARVALTWVKLRGLCCDAAKMQHFGGPQVARASEERDETAI